MNCAMFSEGVPKNIPKNILFDFYVNLWYNYFCKSLALRDLRKEYEMGLIMKAADARKEMLHTRQMRERDDNDEMERAKIFARDEFLLALKKAIKEGNEKFTVQYTVDRHEQHRIHGLFYILRELRELGYESLTNTTRQHYTETTCTVSCEFWMPPEIPKDVEDDDKKKKKKKSKKKSKETPKEDSKETHNEDSKGKPKEDSEEKPKNDSKEPALKNKASD